MFGVWVLDFPAFGAPPTSTFSSAEAEAIELATQGREAYQQGRFQDAARLLLRAYEKKPEPIILFNLARSYEGMGDVPRAIDAYTHYLQDDPETTDHKSIEQRITTLRKQVKEREDLEQQRDEERKKRAEAERRATLRRDPVATKKPNVVPWITFGVGIAGVGVGTTFAILSRNSYQAAVDEPYRAPAQKEYDTARTDALVANVAFVAGGVLAAGGLAWGVVDLVLSRKKPKNVEVELSPTSIVFRRTF